MKLNRKIAATAFGVLALGAAGASLAGAASAASSSHHPVPAVSRQVTPPAPTQADDHGTDEKGTDPATGPDRDTVQLTGQKGADKETNDDGAKPDSEKGTEDGGKDGGESGKNATGAHDTDSGHEDGPGDTQPESGAER
ncbi:hypothetical protein [Actinomadura rupiterrae]|uniref:hypothetical protein n=1 Tax=Actinomadura rupiterrae TaxID=559627 RepID=UPI0020A3672D|nr:hypothetical protein [Actinomadura rupiterrae]MCP2337314.1 hypothetical protein [Actinomadura rupiterrae]